MTDLRKAAEAALAAIEDGYISYTQADVLKQMLRAALAAEPADEIERLRTAEPHVTPQLVAAGEMLAAVVQGAKEEFVRVPYGASHEDVAAINEWHTMAGQALSAWGALLAELEAEK